MFFPTDTIINCVSVVLENEGFEATVIGIDFDFDPEYVNGIKVRRHKDNNILYIDNIDYYLEIIKFPDEYYSAKEHWLITKDQITGQPDFYSDALVEKNKWIIKELVIIEKIPATLTYKEVEKLWNDKFKVWVNIEE